MSTKPPVVLKSRYYLDHFDEMIDFVLARYDHALEPQHRAFVDEFRSLGLDARCLYVRFANRKGRIFYREYLRYPEVADLGAAVDELGRSGFVGTPGSADFRELLVLQTRATLAEWSKERAGASLVKPPRLSSAKKRDLVRFLLENVPFDDCFPPESLPAYLVQQRLVELDYFPFLYFGTLRSGLTTFALRDLGVVKPAGFKTDFEARFETLETATAAFRYARAIERIEGAEPSELRALADEAARWSAVEDPEVEALRHRAIHRLGRQLERAGEAEVALATYRLSDQFPATERAVRLLFQNDDREQAATLLARLIENPSCDEELLFAEDFYERKFQRKRVGRLTAVLRDARVIQLDESSRDRPEAAAVRFFKKEGAEACHTENVVWNQLFGLLFWDLLFEAEDAGIHNHFERKPQGLRSDAFYRRTRDRVDAILARPRETWIERLRATWEGRKDTPNRLFPWDAEVFEQTCRLVELAPAGALKFILEGMAKNHRTARSGFPDLMMVRDSQVSFVEIKAEGDTIRRNQLAQIERLREAGLAVEVARVQWTVDPDQEYVVVDVETTGGSSQWNRITEIGAVRMRGEEILEEWSTLVNPGRRIPIKIVELTGITDEMVREAAPFAAIADEFRDFVGDAVFAAHRARFDYGFVREEFRRIGQEFRLPTLCTVTASRRCFPGLASYGLANLCRELNIPLESHHRALCDARATARLLAKINAQRLRSTKV
ncbi:MAG: exonuclease domain-containing protein [Verrucomicrobiales bacterium]